MLIGGLPELNALGLSGGAFGTVALAVDADGAEVVVKRCRPRGGGRSNTCVVGYHHPDVAFAARHTGARLANHITLDVDDVAAALRTEAALLRRDGGVLLPKLHDLFELPSIENTQRCPAIVMERVHGRRPQSTQDMVRVIENLTGAADSDRLDFHGDLKPEHIFIDVNGTVRLIDPAPRFARNQYGAFTPEYNPYGLTGPVADVFATAVILYELLTQVSPFVFETRPLAPFADAMPCPPSDSPPEQQPHFNSMGVVDLPPPVRRGLGGAPEPLALFIDELLGVRPPDLPPWAFNHASALERLVDSLWTDIEVERRLIADGHWRLVLVHADGGCLTVRVNDSGAWITRCPLSEDGEREPANESRYGARFEGTESEVEAMLSVLRKLPFYDSLDAIGREGESTYWCGDRNGTEIILTETAHSRERGTGRSISLASLDLPTGSSTERGVASNTAGVERSTRVIRLEADWGTSGLWDGSPGGYDSIEIDDMPVTTDLALRIHAWTDRYEALRHRSDYPPEWKFETADDERTFIADGAALADQLRRELGSGWTIEYTPLAPL